MALKEPYMQHLEKVSPAGDIELKPDEDESFLIKSILIDETATSEHFIELKTGRTTVGRVLVEDGGKNHIPYDKTHILGNNIIEELRAKGVNVNYPIASGENFTVRNIENNKIVVIVYEIYDAGDRKKEEVNGSEAKEYYQLNYGYVDVTEMEADAYNLLNRSFLPKEMVAFPFGEAVPAKTEIDLIGIYGIPSYFGIETGKAVNTEKVKIIRERTTLFTKQPDCFAFEPKAHTETSAQFDYGNSQIGFGYDLCKEDVFFLPQVITFTAGEELGVYLKISDKQSVTNIPQENKKIRFGVIERIRRV